MRILLLCSALVLTCSTVKAQTDDFAAYDNATGKLNAAIYNGPIYINPYRLDQNTHQYFGDNTFRKGSVIYNNQPYLVDGLKYDSYQNKLILQSIGDYNNIAIDLIVGKILAFSIENKNFVRLDSVGSSSLSKNQFFEEIVVNPNTKIYVRQHKTRKEIFKGDLIMDRFTPANEYYLFTDGKFVTINSKRDAIAAFPDLKRKINDYAAGNRQLSKSDRSTYMENLLRYIGTLKN